MRKRKSFTKEFKLEAVRLLKDVELTWTPIVRNSQMVVNLNILFFLG